MDKKIKLFGLLFMFITIFLTGNINVKAVDITTNTTSLSTDSSYKQVTNKGSFKIYTNQSSNDRTYFALYKIVNVYYNSSQDALKYQFTTEFQSYLNSSYCPNKFRNLTVETYMTLYNGGAIRDTIKGTGEVVSGGNLTTNDYAELMSSYATYVREESISSNTTITNYYTYIYSYAYTNNVEVGTYLALPYGRQGNDSSPSVFAVMVDSVRLEKNGSTWELKDAKILSKSSYSYLTHSIAKSSSGGYSYSQDVTYETELEGKISFKVPTSPANGKFSTITIKIDKVRETQSGIIRFITSGLTGYITMQSGGEIQYNGTKVGMAKVNATTKELEIDFDGELLPNEVEFVYYAEPLTSTNSVMGANTRNASITFDDPYTSFDVGYKTSGSKIVTLYTYALQITGINGAEFKVTDSSGISKGTVTIGSNGIGELKGLASGTYTVTQTKAPVGYALLSGSQTVKVGTGGTQVSGKTGYYNITMRNSILAMLPFTGSKGTIIFSIIGSLLIIASIIFLIRYKKKKNKVNQNATTN